jgi:hypothetical protein
MLPEFQPNTIRHRAEGRRQKDYQRKESIRFEVYSVISFYTALGLLPYLSW